MVWNVLKSTDSGAPSLTVTNGSMTNVLRWALPQLGFDIAYGASGNAAVFRAQTGNRFRLCINQNNAAGTYGGALVRGAETATSATSWSSTFPTASQVTNSDSLWGGGDPNAPSTPAAYYIYGNEVFFYFLTQVDIADGYWEFQFFGDIPTIYPSAYATVISQAGYPYGNGMQGINQPTSSSPQANYNKLFWCRDVGGTIKSSRGAPAVSGSSFGAVTNAPIIRGGYNNKFYREKVGVHCGATASSTIGPLNLTRRGWLPNLWSPVHQGTSSGVSPLDTFTDTAYNPSAVFRWFPVIPNSGVGVLIEETDTWSIPT